MHINIEIDGLEAVPELYCKKRVVLVGTWLWDHKYDAPLRH